MTRVQDHAHLFDLDPDLADAVPDEDRERAGRLAVVPVRRVDAGPLGDLTVLGAGAELGLLVLGGVFARHVDVRGSAAIELFGAGDLLPAPATAPHAEPTVPHGVRWAALIPGGVAVLDARAAAVAGRWPGIVVELLRRTRERADAEALRFAVSRVTRVDDRVESVLRLLAERWGRVRGDGVHLDVRLTHEVIARLVGARRPSVTSAVQRLIGAGRLTRTDRGTYVLLQSSSASANGGSAVRVA